MKKVFVLKTNAAAKANKAKADGEADAAVLASLAATFGEDEPADKAPKAFVRGGVMGNSATSSTAHHSAGGPAVYVPTKPTFAMASPLSSAAVPQAPPAFDQRAPKEMDLILEEIKHQGANSGGGRDGRHGGNAHSRAGGGPRGGAPSGPGVPSFLGDSDPSTSNVFVGSLAPTVTEEEVGALFAPFGRIHSVKVMWPRTDEERARGFNKG